MNPRAVPVIALRISNSTGRCLMSLHVGQRIYSYSWEDLPIDEYVIEIVESLVETEEEPIMHNGITSFEWTPGIETTDIWEDEGEEVSTIAHNSE